MKTSGGLFRYIGISYSMHVSYLIGCSVTSQRSLRCQGFFFLNSKQHTVTISFLKMDMCTVFLISSFSYTILYTNVEISVCKINSPQWTSSAACFFFCGKTKNLHFNALNIKRTCSNQKEKKTKTHLAYEFMTMFISLSHSF